MPAATLDAVADHGRPHSNAVGRTYDAIRGTFDELRWIGIDFETVVDDLERRGSRFICQELGQADRVSDRPDGESGRGGYAGWSYEADERG